MNLNIDISAGICAGRCDHCSHGRAKIRDEVVSFPDDLVAMYQRLEGYAYASKIDLRVAFMDRLETLPDLPFVQNVQALCLCVSGFSGLIGGDRNALVRRVKEIYGPLKICDLDVQVYPPFDLAELKDVASVGKLVSLQSALLKEGLKSVYFGVVQNKSVTSWQKVQQETWGMMLILDQVWARIDTVGERSVTQQMQRQGAIFKFFHEVSIGDRIFALGGRFIDADFAADAVKEMDAMLADEESRFPLALFPRDVHVNHSTVNINDRTLRFDYGEFGNLLTKAEKSGETLKSVIFRAVQERRA